MAPHIDFLCLAAHVRTFVRNQVDAPAICTRLVLATPAFTIHVTQPSTASASPDVVTGTANVVPGRALSMTLWICSIAIEEPA